MEMIEVKTTELEGLALDWAVAIAEGYTPDQIEDGCWEFSTDWSQGGPLINKYKMHFLKAGDGYAAYILPDHYRPAFYRNGDNHLIAACRVIVAAKLGNFVEIPVELVADHG